MMWATPDVSFIWNGSAPKGMGEFDVISAFIPASLNARRSAIRESILSPRSNPISTPIIPSRMPISIFGSFASSSIEKVGILKANAASTGSSFFLRRLSSMDCNFHPASRSAAISCVCSAEPRSSIVGMLRSYAWPAKGRSLSTKEAHRSPSKVRGAVNLAISSSAFAARSFAADTFISDLRCISRCLPAPILPNNTSAATPSATAESAITDPHLSINESYDGWKNAIAISIIKPPMTKIAPHNAAPSHDSNDRSRSSSLAFITPFVRRSAGKGHPPRPIWIGVLLGIVATAIRPACRA